MLKIRRSRDHLMFNMGIPYLERPSLYWNGPFFYTLLLTLENQIPHTSKFRISLAPSLKSMILQSIIRCYSFHVNLRNLSADSVVKNNIKFIVYVINRQHHHIVQSLISTKYVSGQKMKILTNICTNIWTEIHTNWANDYWSLLGDLLFGMVFMTYQRLTPTRHDGARQKFLSVLSVINKNRIFSRKLRQKEGNVDNSLPDT